MENNPRGSKWSFVSFEELENGDSTGSSSMKMSPDGRDSRELEEWWRGEGESGVAEEVQDIDMPCKMDR